MTPATLSASPSAPAREARLNSPGATPSFANSVARSNGATTQVRAAALNDGDFARYLTAMLRADVDRLGVVAGATWGWTVIVLTVADEVLSQAAALSVTDTVRREMRSLVDEARASVRAVRARLRADGAKAA